MFFGLGLLPSLNFAFHSIIKGTLAIAHVNTAATAIANHNSFGVAEGEKEVQCEHCKGSSSCAARQVCLCKCYDRLIPSVPLRCLSTAMISVSLEAILLGVYKFRIVMSSH